MKRILRIAEGGECAVDHVAAAVDPGFGLHALPARWRALPGDPCAAPQLPSSVDEVKEEDQ